jgi:hypothetical protein
VLSDRLRVSQHHVDGEDSAHRSDRHEAGILAGECDGACRARLGCMYGEYDPAYMARVGRSAQCVVGRSNCRCGGRYRRAVR